MARQNRVTPEGAFIASPARGTLMGNRGILHDAQGRLGTARWRHKAWICCVLRFRGRHRQIMQPNRYTELFFLDEAVALAAGHRPCAECRRADFNAYRATWPGTPRAPEMDAELHRHRIGPGSRLVRPHRGDFADLPDGAFVRMGDACLLVRGDALWPYAPTGYGPARPRPKTGGVAVLTPPPNLCALRAGYAPALHWSADQNRQDTRA
ncbi:hypothetical protein [Actibacterium ureilyticum]|uniref:hypothetical protein n=1 Tax=Actibacterium ureilyticum TaxID=1590614 RepID=UPI000BAA98E0|nr:hypothetical protein [Actibacterium ureilyticum]